MRVTELKVLTRDRGLRNYSRMRKAELVALLQNNPPPPPQSGSPSGASTNVYLGPQGGSRPCGPMGLLFVLL